MVDPSEWKHEIQRLAAKLAAHVEKSRLTHRSRARLERELMVAYYLLGGAYSIQLKANIRMDLFLLLLL